jgi:hypothetical protein
MSQARAYYEIAYARDPSHIRRRSRSCQMQYLPASDENFLNQKISHRSFSCDGLLYRMGDHDYTHWISHLPSSGL